MRFRLDYADQRFFASTYGRFSAADPYIATPTSPSDPGTPQSWNRYAYVTGDPINLFDPGGTCGTPSTLSQTGDIITISVSIPCDGGSLVGGGGRFPVLTPSQPGPTDPSGGGPQCLSLPPLPPGIGSDQISKNIGDTHDFLATAMEGDASTEFDHLNWPILIV
jgi:RHS repeat-associated protein